MRRVVCGMVLLLLALTAAAPAALGAGTRVRVSPGTGGVHTDFVLRFSIPDATGTTGSADVADAVTVSGPGHTGCIGEADLPLRPAPAGAAFTVTLDPSHLNGHWCTGRFNGMLVQRRTTICPPGPVRRAIVCPLYVIAPRVLARFRFTVTQPKKMRTTR
jgi:hypothetical protein